jgi:hypothetical protein
MKTVNPMIARAEDLSRERPVRLKMAGCEPHLHPVMIVSFDGTDTKCCAYSWCSGECGFPAAVITSPSNKEHKLYGSMVACGDVVQHWRVEWTGEKLVVPSAYWDFLSRRIWF